MYCVCPPFFPARGYCVTLSLTRDKGYRQLLLPPNGNVLFGRGLSSFRSFLHVLLSNPDLCQPLIFRQHFVLDGSPTRSFAPSSNCPCADPRTTLFFPKALFLNGGRSFFAQSLFFPYGDHDGRGLCALFPAPPFIGPTIPPP